ncbi:uncharacterized protein PRD47_013806 [Ara ararauna]
MSDTSARRCRIPDSMEQGKSKAPLLQPGRGTLGVVSVGPGGLSGGGRSPQATLGEGPSSPWQAGARVGSGQPPGHPCLQCPFLSKASSPAQQPARQGQSSPWGQSLRDASLALRSFSFPVAFPLSHPACVLCRRAEADPDLCGPKLHHRGIGAHHFCLVSSWGAGFIFATHLPCHMPLISSLSLLQLFASELPREDTEQEGEIRFSAMDIQRAVEQAAQMNCLVCGERGATVACWEMGCNRRFHLPCAVDGECIVRYFPPFRSFCWEHSPQQQEVVAPENTTCLICQGPVEGRTTYGTMVCPACKYAWFHRACIQEQAIRAGISCLQCPLCREQSWFLLEMVHMGIHIPIRPPSWEDNNAYAELYQRHSSCDARECLCPGGREASEPDGPWQLLLCRSCAAECTHRRCSSLGKRHEARWDCDSCAGLGTSSGASSELAGPSTAGPAASRQSPGSVELESSSPSPSSQAALGQALGPEAQETGSPSTSGQMPSGSRQGSPVQDSGRGTDGQQHVLPATPAARRSQGCPEPPHHLRRAGAAPAGSSHRRHPVALHHGKAAGATDLVGPCGCETVPACSIEPKLPKRSPEDAPRAAAHQQYELGGAPAVRLCPGCPSAPEHVPAIAAALQESGHQQHPVAAEHVKEAAL